MINKVQNMQFARTAIIKTNIKLVILFVEVLLRHEKWRNYFDKALFFPVTFQILKQQLFANFFAISTAHTCIVRNYKNAQM